MDNGASSYRRFLEGDESAFDEILEEYRHPLTFFINSYVHDMWTAEDIAIDVFCDLMVRKHRYNFKTKLKTYLFMLGRSRALDYLRRKKRIVFTQLTEAEKLEAEATPEALFLIDEKKRAVHCALSQLPQDMQIAVHLVYFEELSYEEASKIMRKTRKQVDNLLYRSKALLRTALGKEGADIYEN